MLKEKKYEIKIDLYDDIDIFENGNVWYKFVIKDIELGSILKGSDFMKIPYFVHLDFAEIEKIIEKNVYEKIPEYKQRYSFENLPDIVKYYVIKILHEEKPIVSVLHREVEKYYQCSCNQNLDEAITKMKIDKLYSKIQLDDQDILVFDAKFATYFIIHETERSKTNKYII